MWQYLLRARFISRQAGKTVFLKLPCPFEQHARPKAIDGFRTPICFGQISQPLTFLTAEVQIRLRARGGQGFVQQPSLNSIRRVQSESLNSAAVTEVEMG